MPYIDSYQLRPNIQSGLQPNFLLPLYPPFLRDFVQLPLDQRVAHAFRFCAGVILQILGQRQQLFAHLLTLAGGEV